MEKSAYIEAALTAPTDAVRQEFDSMLLTVELKNLLLEKEELRRETMIDLQDKDYCPAIEEIVEYIQNPVFMQFCSEISSTYNCNAKIEYSSCSWEKGWNIKYKKAGKSLCTIYPREGFFTILVVVGNKEKPHVEEILPGCTVELQNIYHQTQEGNGQKWMMVDLADKKHLYDDIMRLIQIRRNS